MQRHTATAPVNVWHAEAMITNATHAAFNKRNATPAEE
jgi:hypothetical protein